MNKETIIACLTAICLLPAGQALATSGPGCLVVVNVGPGDALNMRDASIRMRHDPCTTPGDSNWLQNTLAGGGQNLSTTVMPCPSKRSMAIKASGASSREIRFPTSFSGASLPVSSRAIIAS
jgi:hypothetical protein